MSKTDYIISGNTTQSLVDMAVTNERERVIDLILSMRVYDKQSNEYVNSDRFKLLTLVRMGVEADSDEMRKVCEVPNDRN